MADKPGWSDKPKPMPPKHLHGSPKSFSPQLALLVDHPPQGDDWIHEIKFDGYRMIAHLERDGVRLMTRNGNDWTSKFPGVAKSLATLKNTGSIIDGEVVILDSEGRSDFQALQAMLKSKTNVAPRYYAFDLPFHHGRDLRDTPLLERKKALKELLDRPSIASQVVYSAHVRGSGDDVLRKACEMSLEGIISKRVDAPYVSRREATWVKSKCQQRQEFVVIGWTDPQGGRTGFGSLLLGYHDPQQRLVYAGRVGTGFNDKLLRDLHGKLVQLKQKDPPTAVPPPARERRAAHWVKPTLVAEVRFTGWTRDAMLRHPAFIALRSDKPASQIVRELPAHTEEVTPRANGKGRTADGSAGSARKTPGKRRTSRSPGQTDRNPK